ncbi:MAG: aromatic amino acid transport family protein [Patescibacteria group bacterium]
MKKTVFAIAILMSTIVGVGLFGLPYAGAQSGFLIAAIFLFLLTGIMVSLHLMYGEIVLHTKEKHRSPGYAGIYLGKIPKYILSCSVVLGFFGSLLAYIIVGGNFLNTILSPILSVDPIVFNLLFFFIGAIVIYFGLHLIAGIDLIVSVFLILIVFLFLFLGIPNIDISNLKTINFSKLFFPYGVILYSLSGMAAIPEIRELFGRKDKGYRRSIIIGMLIPSVLYLVFLYVVVGLTGINTSPDAINGLIGVLGDKVVYLGSVFGFLACITSFFIIGLSLKKVFWYDFKINKNVSWFLVCLVPLVLFLLGFSNFIFIIVVLGALLGAIEGSSIVLIYKKVRKLKFKRKKNCFRFPDLLRYAIIVIFLVGFVYTLISILS